MEKVFLGMLALTLLVSVESFASGKKKGKKAKTECTQNCCDSNQCCKKS